MRRSHCEEGFTLIEVMISMLVFMVALLGLVAMQEASIEGAGRAREQTAAVNIARFVMAGIQNEVTGFTFESELPTADQPLLDNAINGGNEGLWVNLPGTGGISRFDAYLEHDGRSFYDTVDSAPYCAIYQVDRFLDGAGVEMDGLYKVKVRVAWPRKGQYQGADWMDCTLAARKDDIEGHVGLWEVVELRTVMSREFTSRWVFNW
jgi:type II secretory pathway pseudopilin PulG